MQSGQEKKLTLFLTVFVVVLLFITVVPFVVKAADPTLVQGDPSNTTVSAQQTFTLNISCVPSQPIKSFELKISFNPSLLQANSVQEGTIFSGYTTFFNDGIINNVAGTIINIYNLIIGPENVSNPGTLVSISFTAKSYSGTSPIHFYDVGLTDDLGYVVIDVSDAAVTILGQGGNPPDGGGYNPGGGVELPSEPKNTPPATPVKPIGPAFIERGVSYEYTSSASDSDGDQVRLRFDWGDGNYSDWSVFVDSNMTVTSSHNWGTPATFSIRVIAQDENRSNSSWSIPLNVTVSEQGAGEYTPVIDIMVPDNRSANQTIIFDVLVIADPNSEIISYTWDFGDGTIGTGKNPNHTYSKPGEYSITLTITDSTGKTSTKTILISVDAGAKSIAQNQESPFSNLGIIMIVVLCIVGICLVILSRKKLVEIFSTQLMARQQKKIEQLNLKIGSIHESDRKHVTKHYVTDNQKLSKTIDSPSVEEQVDQLLLSKIEDKIDKM